MAPCGAGQSHIIVSKNGNVLFEGENDVDFVTCNGYLAEPFVSLLSDEMWSVYQDPEAFLETHILTPLTSPFDPYPEAYD